MLDTKIYLTIDLKSFYASVECVDRKLNPLTTNLVVADKSRTEKTICLAVTPSLKQYGIAGRSRLFEVMQQVKEINYKRKRKAPNRVFTGTSFDDIQLRKNPSLAVSYIIAKPRMAHYIEVSNVIYNIYLSYVSKEDIHVYSIDEVFIDITSYLLLYNQTPEQLAKKILTTILKATGITATVGIGTNLYLAKVAMDILSKHIEPDKDGTRIAYLDEQKYRDFLWGHTPITDFWRIGNGYAKRLAAVGLYTMGDIAKCSIGKSHDYYNEDLLYHIFGVNAELLIDHAWGCESCTMEDIKAYQPSSKSISNAQVLEEPYPYHKTKLVLKEMLDALALELVDKGLLTNQIVWSVGYDANNINDQYKGSIKEDHYGRKIPKHARGTVNFNRYTSSSAQIMKAVLSSFDKKTNKKLTVRRIHLTANHVSSEHKQSKPIYEQMSLFVDYKSLEKKRKKEQQELDREKKLQKATLELKRKYGKNAVLKGMDLEEGATTIKRNDQIGGHKA